MLFHLVVSFDISTPSFCINVIPVTLLNSFALVFLWILSDFLYIASVNRDFFLSNLDTFFFLSNYLAQTFSTMLNSNGESGHPCLGSPDLGGKSFQSFTTEFLLLLSQFFINVLYHVKEVAFYF